jgi:hypothetical protein
MWPRPSGQVRARRTQREPDVELRSAERVVLRLNLASFSPPHLTCPSVADKARRSTLISPSLPDTLSSLTRSSGADYAIADQLAELPAFRDSLAGEEPMLERGIVPRRAPDPGAPPHMRQRRLPLTADYRQGLPERVLAPQRRLESIGRVRAAGHSRAFELCPMGYNMLRVKDRDQTFCRWLRTYLQGQRHRLDLQLPRSLQRRNHNRSRQSIKKRARTAITHVQRAQGRTCRQKRPYDC